MADEDIKKTPEGAEQYIAPSTDSTLENNVMSEQDRNLAELQSTHHNQIGRLFSIWSNSSRVSRLLEKQYGKDFAMVKPNLRTQTNEKLRPQALNIIDKYPGIFSEDHRQHWLQEADQIKGNSVKMVYFQTTVNEDGTIPIQSRESGIVDLSKEDFELSEKLLLDEHQNPKEVLSDLAQKAERILAKIDYVIEKYTSESKPTIQDMLQGQSVGEPYLQNLVGGSSEEGQTAAINYISTPAGFGVETVDTPEGEYWITSIFANYDLLRRGRETAASYYSFVSECIGNTDRSDIRSSDNATKERFYQHYLDEEWARKDEAILIAQSIKETLTSLLDYYRELEIKIGSDEKNKEKLA